MSFQWHGYQPWSRQIPTRDFKSTPGPITKDKLAKSIAKVVDRFITVSSFPVVNMSRLTLLSSIFKETKDTQMIYGSNPAWKVGNGDITLDDLVLIALLHVSRGSWQVVLCLNRELPTVYQPRF